MDESEGGEADLRGDGLSALTAPPEGQLAAEASERATARAVVLRPARLRVPGSRREREIRVDTVDIGPDGAEIVASEEVPVGATVQLRCALPGRNGSTRLKLAAIVRSRTPVRAADMVLGRGCFRHSLEFHRLSAREEAEILRVVFHLQISARTKLAHQEGPDAARRQEEPR